MAFFLPLDYGGCQLTLVAHFFFLNETNAQPSIYFHYVGSFLTEIVDKYVVLHQDIRMGAIPHPITSGHSSGLNMGQEIVMPRIHDHAGFPSMPPRGPPQKMFGSADFANVPAADSYCKHHEITVMVIYSYWLHRFHKFPSL